MRSPGTAAGGPIAIVYLKQRDENWGGVTNRLHGFVKHFRQVTSRRFSVRLRGK